MQVTVQKTNEISKEIQIVFNLYLSCINNKMPYKSFINNNKKYKNKQ